jgi:Concanavalin A-like lectin/glucanases superfamily/Domain of unknown function (DUF5050)
MKKTIGLCCVVLVVLLTLVCSKHERNNVFDTGGSNWRPPVVSAMPDTVVAVLDTINLHVTVTDSNARIAKFIWLGIDTSFLDTTPAPISRFRPLSSKHLRVAVRAVDENGIPSNWDTTVLDVHSYFPTITVMADTTIAIFDSVRFHALGFDTNGVIAHYVWSVPSCRMTDTTKGGVFATRFDTGGTFPAIVHAVDNSGFDSPSDTFIVSVHTYAPLVSVTDSFLTTGVGNAVHLSAHGTDTNGTIAGYAWCFNGTSYVRTAASTYDTSFATTGMKVVLVKAIDDDSLMSRADTIRIAVQGNKPLLYAPINHAVTPNLSVVLTWMPGYYNHQYLVQFDTTSKFSISISRTDTFLDISSSLKFGTAYYWRVIGVSATGASDTSDTWTFSTPAMARIQLLSPADNTTLAIASATLSWQPGYYRSHFQILVDTLNPPAQTVITSQADTFYAAGNLSYVKKYYWRVVASDLSGNRDSSSVRSFTTPAAPIVPTGGLVAYYPFNGNANDSSGHGYNGTVAGATLATDRFGNANSAYLFDSTSYVQPGITLFRTDSNFTVSAWYKGHPDANGFIVGQYSGQSGSCAFWINFINNGSNNLPGIQAVCGTSAGLSAILTPQHDTSSWHHAAIVYNRGSNIFHLYSDNIDTFITLSSPIVYSSSVPFRIGMTTDANHTSLKGKIDDVRFYSQALSAGEISALYHANGWTGPATLQPPVVSSDSASMPAAATVGVLYKDTIHAKDPQNQALTYSVLSGPSGIAVADSILSWTPAASDVGPHNVKVLIRNTSGLGDTLSWTVTVGRTDGLVAYYPFTGNANDSSGYGYNGLVKGATLTTDRFGNANGAYYFAGSGDSILATIPILPTGSQPRTVCAFIKDDGNGGADQYVVGWGGIPAVVGSTWWLNIYQSQYRIVNGIDEPRAGAVDTGKWVQFAATYDGDTVKVYKNGTFVAKSGKITLVTNSNILGFGRFPTGPGSDFKGALDDVRIYNRALTPVQIDSLFHLGGWTGSVSNQAPVLSSDSASMTPTATVGVLYIDTVHATNPNGRRVIYSVLSGPTGFAITDSIVSWTPASSNLGSYNVKIKAADSLGLCDTLSWTITVSRSDGLISYYPFTGNANDSSGNGHNGAVIGATLSIDRFGNANSCYSFNGTSQYVNCGNLGAINDISVSVWFTYQTSGYFFGTSNSGNRYFNFGIGSDSTLYYSVSSQTASSQAGHLLSIVSKGIWHNAVITRTGGTVQLSLDGVNGLVVKTQDQNFSGTITTGVSSGIGAVFDGNGSAPSVFFGGKVDDVRIFNRILTAHEIDSLYRIGGWAGYPPVFSSDSASMTATATVGVIYKDTVRATNPNGRRVIYNVLSGPTGLAMTDSVVSWTPSNSNLGSNNVKIKAADSLGLCDTLSWTITVSRADGLIAFYPFTGNAGDSSGYGRNGTVNGAVLTTDRFGSANSAYGFNGSSFLDIGKLGDINDVTISLWAKPDSIPAAGTGYYVFGSENYNNNNFDIDMSSNYTPYYNISRVTANSIVGYLNKQLTFKQWHHIVLTRSGQTIKIFLDGDTLGPMVFASGYPQGNLGTMNVGTNFYIGSTYNPTIVTNGGIKGAVDEVRIYSRAISGSEAQALYRLGGWVGYPPVFSSDSASMTPTATVGLLYKDTVHATNPNGRRVIYSVLSGPTGLAITDSIVSWTPAASNVGNCNVKIKAADSLSLCDTLSWTITVGRADGLVAYYPFTGNSNDSSGNGYNGANQNATLAEDRFGHPNSSYYFNGTNAIINCGVLNLNTSKSFSVSVWYKAQDFDYGGLVIEGDCSAPQPNFSYFVNFGYENPPTMRPRVGVQNASTQLSVDFALNDTANWHNMALVYDSSAGAFSQYFDGVLKGSQSTTTPNDISLPTTIGQSLNCNSSGFFKGFIDDVRIYNCALTQTRIDSLYHLGGWTGPVVSPGNSILFVKRVTGSGNSGIYRMAPDGSNQVLISDTNGYNSDARYSPDMTQIVYSSSGSTNGKQQIFIMNADGSGKQQLTTWPDNAWGPQIVGSKIWFVATAGSWDQRVYTMNMDGSGVTQVSSFANGQCNYFKVVGSSVYGVWATAGNSNGSRIYSASVNFSTISTISSVEYCMFDDASPDGNTCIRSRLDNTGSGQLPQNIYVLKTDGTGETKLSQFTGTNQSCDWAKYSPDGARVAYGVSDQSQTDIYIINSDGTGNTQITNTSGYDEWPCDWR